MRRKIQNNPLKLLFIISIITSTLIFSEIFSSSMPKTVAGAFFYWYDDETGSHLWQDHICTHPPIQDEKGHYPGYSYKDKSWHKRQILDMMEAGINVITPQYWGNTGSNFWNKSGLLNLLESLKELENEGFKVPKVAPYIDTTAVLYEQFKDNPELLQEMNRGDSKRRWVMDMKDEKNVRLLYKCIHDSFIPLCGEKEGEVKMPLKPQKSPFWNQWSLSDGFPMIFIYEAGRGFFFWDWDRTLFENILNWFEKDFGLKPRLYPDYEWSLKDPDDDERAFNLNGGGYIRWRSAVYEPYVMNTPVQMPRKGEDCVQIGPGYDDRDFPGRTKNGHPIRSRDFGYFYCYGWQYAIRSNRNLVMLESWNELHESTNISDCQEFGRKYIRLTRDYTKKFQTDYSKYSSVWCELMHTNNDFLTVINDEEGLYQVDGGVVKYVDQEFGKEETDYLIDTPPKTDGKTMPTWRGNRQCRSTQLPDNPYIYFDIDDNFVSAKQNQNKQNDFYILVEYFDEGTDSFRIRYDAEPYKLTAPVKKGDSRQWKFATFYLPDAKFNNSQAKDINYYSFLKKGCDFLLDSMKDGDEYISKVIVSSKPYFINIEPQEPVYLGIPIEVKISLIITHIDLLSAIGGITIEAEEPEIIEPIKIEVVDLIKEPRSFKISFRKPGRYSLIAKDSNNDIISISKNFLVQKYRIESDLVSLNKNDVKFIVTVLDEKGNPDKDYRGTIWFPPVKMGDKTPTSYQFTEGDQGKHPFTISFRTYGLNSVYIQDERNYTFEGQQQIIVPPPGCIIDFKPVPEESGLYLIYASDGWVKSDKKNGEYCYKLYSRKSQSRHLYLNIDDNSYYDLPRYNDFYINVEYLDKGTDSFMLQYDSNDCFDAPGGFKVSPFQMINKTNSGKWCWVTFRLEDAKFINRTNGADFRIVPLEGNEYIRSVSVSSSPGINKGINFKIEVNKTSNKNQIRIIAKDLYGEKIKDYQGTICIMILHPNFLPIFHSFNCRGDVASPFINGRGNPAPTTYNLKDSGEYQIELPDKVFEKIFVYEVGNLNHWGISQ